MKNYERENNNRNAFYQHWAKTKDKKTGKESTQLLEIIAPTDEFNKITIKIQKTIKEAGGNKTETTTTYFSLQSWLAICNNIMNTQLQLKNEAEKNRVLRDGGYAERIMLKQDGTENKDGSIIARAFYFQPATASKSANIMLCIENGKGYKNGNLYTIDYKNNVTRHSMPLTYTDLTEMACICNARINAIITARQISGYYESKYQPNTGAFEEEQQIIDTYDDYIDANFR